MRGVAARAHAGSSRWDVKTNKGVYQSYLLPPPRNCYFSTQLNSFVRGFTLSGLLDKPLVITSSQVPVDIVPSPPPVRAFIFIAQRVQHSQWARRFASNFSSLRSRIFGEQISGKSHGHKYTSRDSNPSATVSKDDSLRTADPQSIILRDLVACAFSPLPRRITI